VTIAASTQGMERDIKGAFNRVNPEAAGRKAGQQFSSGAASGVNLSGVQSKMAAAGSVGAKALGGALTLGVAAVGTAVAGTLGSALSKGFDRLKAIDDAKFKLKALGNSASDVQTIMDSALASVKGTAYGLGDAATIAASAVAAGVKPGQELTNYLKLTADTAAVAGTSLSDMGRIINQVRTSGNAYTEDLNQLADRGIPIYQWLGDAAGVAAGDVKKLAADGKISSQLLEQAISKNIGGAAKTMGQSFSGAVENANAALGRLGEALLKPMFANASGGIASITNALDSMTAWINNNQGMIIGFWQNISVAAVSVAQDVLRSVGSITEAMGQLVGVAGDVQGAMLKVQSAAARFRGDTAQADELNAQAEAAFGWGESLQTAGQKMMSTADSMDRAKDSIRAWGDEAKLAANNPLLAKLGADVVQQAANVQAAFDKLPKDVPVNVSAPGGQETFDLLSKLGVQVSTNNDKQITVDAPMAPEVLKLLEDLGIKVTTNNDKTITVTQTGAEQASTEIDQAARDREATIRVLVDTQAAAIDAGAQIGVTPRANGAIVPMAEGGLRMIEKPDNAGIYEGRGAGTIFAEEETGGEAYIPLAPAKRDRSTQILSEVAKIFGFSLAKSGATTTSSSVSGGSVVSGSPDLGGFAGAVTGPIVNVLEQILSALSSSRGGYSGSSTVSLASSDAALLAQVPKGGIYSATGDLSKGLADCTSGIEDLVNLMDGMPTAGRSMATGNAAEWLTANGFMPTDTPMPGTFQVGYNSHHMEATLPGGTNINYGSDASVASGGTAGASGAWDPSFTQQYYRPVGNAWKKLAKSSEELTATIDERTDAEKQLTDAANAQSDTVTQQIDAKKDGNNDMSSLGQSLFGGVLQSIGLDGSLFSDPTQWANTKSLTALANWGGGLMQGIMGGGQSQDGSPTSDSGGGSLGIPGIPNIADFLKPLPAGAMTPTGQDPQPHQGAGAQPGPAVVVNGNVGMDPRQFTQRVDAAQNQSVRRNLNSVRP
jgi:tape measure domain-containing protein